MKALITGLLLMISVPSFAWVNLTCDSTLGFSYVILGADSMNCHDRKGNSFDVDFEGYGLGAELLVGGAVKIFCPLASKKRILDGHPLVVVGPKLSISLLGGAQLAAGMNHRGAVCTLGGVHEGVGVSALVGKMTIKKAD